MKIYYETKNMIDVPDNFTEEEIYKFLKNKLHTDDFYWMYEQQYLEEF